MQRRLMAESLEGRLMLAAVPDGPEFRVNTHTASTQAFPSTAMDAAGDFVVAWQSAAQDDFPSASDGVYAQRFNAAGLAQGGEFLVNTTVVRNQIVPQVAMDAAGDFVIAWQSPDASDDGIYARRYSAAGAAQGGEFLVNTSTDDRQSNPAVAMDAAGDFVITWQSHDRNLAIIEDVYARRYSRTGAALGAEFRANTRVVDHQWNPTVAMDAGGGFVIAWESSVQDPDGSTGIYAQRYNAAGGTVGGEFGVNTYTISDQNIPAVAMDAAGDFVVTWHGVEVNGSLTGVYARYFNAAGAAGGEFKVNTTVPGFQRYAAVAIDADGDFVIAWQNENGDPLVGKFRVDAQRFAAGGARVGSEFTVNSTTLGDHRNPTVAMDAAGDFVVAWAGYGQDPGDANFESGVYAQRYATPHAPRVTAVYARGTTWTAPFLSYLQAQGLGSSRFGYAVGDGAAELADLPWRNVNQISVTFGGDVTAVQQNLAVRGVNIAGYLNTAFVYDVATHTGTWTLGQSIANDKVLLDLGGVVAAGAGGLALDGDWTTGATFPSGNGAAGGNFKFRFNVLPGNVNRVGSVLADDFSAVKARFFKSTAAPGSGATAYSIYHDVDGSGSILADDYSAVKVRFFTALPGPEPTLAPAAGLFADATIAGDRGLRALLA